MDEGRNDIRRPTALESNFSRVRRPKAKTWKEEGFNQENRKAGKEQERIS
jgi:hypothetical protein